MDRRGGFCEKGGDGDERVKLWSWEVVKLGVVMLFPVFWSGAGFNGEFFRCSWTTKKNRLCDDHAIGVGRSNLHSLWQHKWNKAWTVALSDL